jgi:hypothetical protein
MIYKGRLPPYCTPVQYVFVCFLSNLSFPHGKARNEKMWQLLKSRIHTDGFAGMLIVDAHCTTVVALEFGLYQ